MRFPVKKYLDILLLSVVLFSTACSSLSSSPQQQTARLPTGQNSFSDQELQTLIQDPASRGLIFTWSPQMPYSYQSYPAILGASRKLGLPLTVLVDGNADGSDVARVLDKNKKLAAQGPVLSNDSESLMEKGAYLHFPSVVVYSKGEVGQSLILGAKSQADYEDLIQKALNAPKGTVANDDKELVPVDRSGEWEVVQREHFSHRPMYFLRPFSDGQLVPYCSNLRNWLWDLKTGVTRSLPGINDPVPTPDQKYLTLPYPFIPFFTRIDFLEVSKDQRVSRFYADHATSGAYQSVSVLASGPLSSTYRVVSEAVLKKGRLRMQEYTVTHRIGDSAPKVKRKYKSAVKFCPGEELTLPMLSKTGRFFAGVDPFTRRMKIYAIDEKGKCKLLQDPGFISAKVDFSFDDQRLVAHVSSIIPRSVARVVARPSKTIMGLNVVEYNLVTNEYSQLTKCQDRNCYYPSFLTDGRIMYIEQFKTEDRYDLVVMAKKK
jgi:hypothetical protein